MVVDANEQKETQLYYLDETTMKNVPNSRMERLMMVLSSTPHEALLSLHANLQGIVFILNLNMGNYTVLRFIYRSSLQFLSISINQSCSK